jgi:hypothetical protein
LILEKEGTYFFKTYVYSEKEKPVDIHISGHMPDAVYLNGEQCHSNNAILSSGSNCLIVYYKNIKPNSFDNSRHPIDQRTRSAVVLMDKNSKLTQTVPLSMKWYNQNGINSYDIYKGKNKYGYYRFLSPPGLQKIECNAFGKLRAWANGTELRIEKKSEDSENGNCFYTIFLDHKIEEFAEVCLEVEHLPGYYKGRAFPEPLKLICGKGNIQTGDWSEKSDVLKCYSGGLWYRKKVKLSKKEIAGNIFIDLGEVVASAEVHINGKKAGMCMKKPFRLDIKDFVKEGENFIEILVYSTLANHYYTIPTPDIYKSSFRAGLVGPVKICYSAKNKP